MPCLGLWGCHSLLIMDGQQQMSCCLLFCYFPTRLLSLELLHSVESIGYSFEGVHPSEGTVARGQRGSVRPAIVPLDPVQLSAEALSAAAAAAADAYARDARKASPLPAWF